MRDKFLKGVINKSKAKLVTSRRLSTSHDKITASILFNATELYGETRVLTAYCGKCDNIEMYQQMEVVEGVLNCTKCKAKIILNANNIVYNKAKTGGFTAYEERHSRGFISIENLVEVVDNLNADADLGIQIAEDGRVWICIDGISFLRFKPKN